MKEQIKFVYPQNWVPSGLRGEDGLMRMIRQGADGSLNASDLGIKFELSPEARRDITAIENNIRRGQYPIPLWDGLAFFVD
ncbi:MAG: hypothetical protein AAB573_01465 [Patescibacteria group bacterium]